MANVCSILGVKKLASMPCLLLWRSNRKIANNHSMSAMRVCIAGVVVILSQAALVSVVIRQPGNVEGGEPVVAFIRSLEQSYVAASTFEVESETFFLEHPVDFDHATEGDVLLVKGKVHRQRLTRHAPGQGAIFDDTHPVQRPIVQTPTGWLVTPEGMFNLGFDTREEKEIQCQRLGASVTLGMAAPYCPPYFPDLARWYTESSQNPPTLATEASGVRILRTDQGEIHVDPNGAITRWTTRRSSSDESRARIVSSISTPFMKAGFPRLILREALGKEGKPVQSAVLFGEPREVKGLDPATFQWTHYATVAVDMQTGERIVAPGKTDPATRIEQAPATTGRKAITFRADSEGMMLPETGFTPSRWLLAGGVSCLVLAVAFFVRRRIKG